MASTFSPNFRFELPATGEKTNVWGTIMDTFMGTLLESALGGKTSIVMGDADYTLSTSNGAADESRAILVDITSSVPLTANRNVLLPAVKKFWLIKNGTSGSKTLGIFTGTISVGLNLPNGKTGIFYTNGSNTMTSAFDYIPGGLDVSAYASSSTGVVSAGQLQQGSLTANLTGGSANAYTLGLTPALTGYSAGTQVTILPNFTNTGAATINIDSLGAKAIRRNNAALLGGEIPSGVPVQMIYDGTTAFHLLGGGSIGVQNLYSNGVMDYTGSGTPEGVITAPVGSTYRRSNGGAGTSFYVKESGSGNTGWVAK